MSRIRAKRSSQKALKEFLQEIQSFTAGEEWYISLEDVLRHFSIPIEDYYRYIYEKKESSVDGFSQDNIDILVNLLHDSGVIAAKEGFSKAGYFFSGDQLIDFQELFQSITLSKLQNHEINRESLEVSLAGCSDAKAGFSFYCDSVVDMNDHIELALRIYIERNKIQNHAISRSILKNYIQGQLERGYIKRDDLLSGLKENLLKKAVLWNFISPDRSLPLDDRDVDVTHALEVLEFTGEKMIDEGRLKVRYREMVKKYHPDLNPAGLEKTRKINAAYAFLMNRYFIERAS